MDVEHKFGGKHTDIKLEIVRRYIEAYLLVMSKQNFRNIYIDAFAGTGSRTVSQNGIPLLDVNNNSTLVAPGSASLVLQMEKGFDHHIFIDKNPKHVAALQALTVNFPNKSVECFQGDANELVTKFCNETDWKGNGVHWGTRAVLFLDPYGMEVEWKTLKAIAATQTIDLWFLFPMSGLVRQAARRWSSLDDSKINAITRCLGTEEWREKLYTPDLQLGLFSEPELERKQDVRALESYVKERLETVFSSWVSDPIPLISSRGAQLYSLFFAISNPRNAAKGIARKIVEHLRKGIK
ncbi:three-Cys-motif partner protein [Thalassospira sp. MBR-102]|uniref:Three-Cys-motif partner protein TcmP n=1 Tax=Thalassospira permensis NBRC 106175 TaxID=1353532 RepID=A0ABR4TJL4_9PROT|nr:MULTISPECIES: three-Cys-motif partner protein TcmP [Thalassospira]KEO52506.1 hypothetical protein SMB34_07645 [Thalassospira permensis NBRC 106175]MBO9507997.1 three-Cys-motif partner protein TcmP [Thalassospira sp. A3_1]